MYTPSESTLRECSLSLHRVKFTHSQLSLSIMNGFRGRKHKCESSVSFNPTHSGCELPLHTWEKMWCEGSALFFFFLLLRSVSQNRWFVFLPISCHSEKTLLGQRGRLSAEGHSFSFCTSLPSSLDRRPLLLLWLNDNTTSLPTVKGEQLISGSKKHDTFMHYENMAGSHTLTHTHGRVCT